MKNMKINVEDNLFIESDSYGYTVTRYNTRFSQKEQKEVESKELIANFGTVQGCADYIVNKLKVHESTATTLRELIEEVKQNREWIKQKLEF